MQVKILAAKPTQLARIDGLGVWCDESTGPVCHQSGPAVARSVWVSLSHPRLRRADLRQAFAGGGDCQQALLTE